MSIATTFFGPKPSFRLWKLVDTDEVASSSSFACVWQCILPLFCVVIFKGFALLVPDVQDHPWFASNGQSDFFLSFSMQTLLTSL